MDLIDIVNLLHHIPVLSTLYREASEDEISPAARALGGLLYGGPLGFVNGLANAIVEEASGQDIGETLMAALGADDEPAATTAVVAGAAQPAAGDNVAEALPAREASGSARLESEPPFRPTEAGARL